MSFRAVHFPQLLPSSSRLQSTPLPSSPCWTAKCRNWFPGIRSCLRLTAKMTSRKVIITPFASHSSAVPCCSQENVRRPVWYGPSPPPWLLPLHYFSVLHSASHLHWPLVLNTPCFPPPGALFPGLILSPNTAIPSPAPLPATSHSSLVCATLPSYPFPMWVRFLCEMLYQLGISFISKQQRLPSPK